jgi:photosystem II stability/assembly factor-like uncharacterized protein
MKNLILFVLLVFNCTNINSQWVQKPNDMGANKQVWALAVSGDNIFAGTNAGVYLSTNNGENWSLTSLNNQSGNALLVNGNNLFAGTNNGIFLSTNNGLNWTQTGLSSGSVWALAVKNNYLFAGTSGSGIYISTNNGVNWTHTVPTSYVSSLIVHGNNILAGDWSAPTVFISTDNGSNWTSISTGGSSADVILSLASLNNIVYAGADNGGVFKSTNGGLNWTQCSLNQVGIVAFTIKDNNIFAGDFFDAKVYLSTNSGVNWVLKNQGLGEQNSVWSLTTNSQYIFAGTDSSVWRRDLSEIIKVQNISTNVPDKYSLEQNYPNPFNPTTTIKFQIKDSRFVTLKVYDILGKEVAVLVNEKQPAGVYEVSFDASVLPSGIYFYKLIVGESEASSGQVYTETKKMVLVK